MSPISSSVRDVPRMDLGAFGEHREDPLPGLGARPDDDGLDVVAAEGLGQAINPLGRCGCRERPLDRVVGHKLFLMFIRASLA